MSEERGQEAAVSGPGPPRLFGATPAPREFCAQRTWRFSGGTLTLYRRCPR